MSLSGTRPPGDDKVSMLTIHTHTNPWGRLKWPYAITRLIAHFICGWMSARVICKVRKSMVIHDTECPYWDQVSLNNTNQTYLVLIGKIGSGWLDGTIIHLLFNKMKTWPKVTSSESCPDFSLIILRVCLALKSLVASILPVGVSA